MDKKFDEMFNEKFGQAFSSESMKFLHKSVMYEGWLLHKQLMQEIIDEVDSETNKGE